MASALESGLKESSIKVLVVEDDAELREAIVETLELSDMVVESVPSAEQER